MALRHKRATSLLRSSSGWVNMTRARTELAAAITAFGALQDYPRGQASARHTLGAIDRLEGEYAAAREQFTAVLGIWRKLGDRSGEAQARHDLAALDREQGDYVAAREQFTTVLELWRELGDRSGEANTRHSLACNRAVPGQLRGGARAVHQPPRAEARAP